MNESSATARRAAPEPSALFLQHLQTSLQDDTFVKCSLSRPVAEGAVVERVTVRLIQLKGAPHLSFTLREARRDVTRNHPVAAGLTQLTAQIGREFQTAVLATTQRDWQLTFNARGEARLVSHQPAHKAAPQRSHDRDRSDVLDATAQDWLHGLEITEASGKVRASMADKFRQINRYLELLTHLVRETPAPANGEWVIGDMGCGKGYLTFGAWHLFHRQLQQSVRVIGVEAQPKLVGLTNSLASAVGAKNLEFREGTIETAQLPPLDVLIALHACNTATDAAILRGIAAGTRLIIVAPCCHQEVRPQLQAPPVLAGVMRHGIMAERLAEWATDGLRALYLEWAGYQTRVLEFISSEHTAKNLMIAGIRQEPPFTDTKLRDRIRELKQFLGIQHHALDALLDKSA